MIAAQRGGIIYAATHPMEITAAERLIAALKWPETVRFGSSSTEMVQAALEVARAATGRRRVVQFFGHYHGWIDNIYLRRDEGRAVPFGQGQLPEALHETIATDWNDIAALQRVSAQHPGEIAAVIMEPVMLNAGAILPTATWQASATS